MTIAAEELPVVAPRRPYLVELDEEDRRRREATRVKACEDFAAEAAEHGYCERCWARSTHYGRFLGQAKKVRHRRWQNCPHVRKQNG